MNSTAQAQQAQAAQQVVMGLVRAAPQEKRRALLIKGADLLTRGEFEKEAAAIRAQVSNSPEQKAAQAAIEKATAAERKAAEQAAEALKSARAAERKAAEQKAQPALDVRKAGRQQAGLAVVNAALAKFGEKPLPLVISVPTNAAQGLAQRLNTC